MPTSITRRHVMALAGAVAAAGPARAGQSGPLKRAYDFLGSMMDLYGQGATPRLAQSYVSTTSKNFSDHAYSYDNAVVLIAYLQRGWPDDLSRASVLGQSLAYAQAHDPEADGRLRACYHADPFISNSGAVEISSNASDCGDVAWAGLAFCKLFAATGSAPIRAAAVAAGRWIQAELYDARGAGGYLGGFTASGVLEEHKGTENNIDVAAFFAMLARIDASAPWSTYSAYAQSFVDSMWDAQTGCFWVGTLNDGVTPNTSPLVEDAQAWSYLAAPDSRFAGALDWVVANLGRTDRHYAGPCFSTVDGNIVWFEGAAHMAAALSLRQAPGDAALANLYLASIERAQKSGRNADGQGVIAASGHLPTGFGGAYSPNLHIGATGWYCRARQGGNPFV
jgi:hypothetical protein